jgi:hypothetical protein
MTPFWVSLKARLSHLLGVEPGGEQPSVLPIELTKKAILIGFAKSPSFGFLHYFE